MNNAMNNGDPAGLLCVGGVFLVIAVLVITIWWRVFAKTGWGGAMGLLMLLPIINLIMLLVLAFAEWPVQAEVRRLRRELAERDEYGGGGGMYGGSPRPPRRGVGGEGEGRFAP